MSGYETPPCITAPRRPRGNLSVGRSYTVVGRARLTAASRSAAQKTGLCLDELDQYPQSDCVNLIIRWPLVQVKPANRQTVSPDASAEEENNLYLRRGIHVSMRS